MRDICIRNYEVSVHQMSSKVERENLSLNIIPDALPCQGLSHYNKYEITKNVLYDFNHDLFSHSEYGNQMFC